MKDNLLETIQIDVYPWAAPTAEQRASFDALSPEEKRKALEAAISDGFSGGISDKPIDTIIAEAKADLKNGI